MLIKLPICIDDKIIFSTFILKKSDTNIFLDIFNRKYEILNQKIKVPLCNNYTGISYLDLYFPLEFKIINNKLYFNNFFQKIILSQNNLPIDFFMVLEKYLDNVSYITIDDIYNYENDIWKYWNNCNDVILLNNYKETIKSLWETVQLYLNYSLFLIYINPLFTNKTIKDYQKKYKIKKKIISIANGIKELKFPIYFSNDYTFIEHYDRINNKLVKIVELKIGYKYFIKSKENDKFFQIEIKNINEEIIYTEDNQTYIYNNYEWYFYIPILKYNLDIIIYELMTNNKIYNEYFEKTNLQILPIHTTKIIEYYNSYNNECNLIYFTTYFNEFTELEILKRNNYSNIFMEYITKKYSDNIENITKILTILFANYSYPIKQNKLDSNFEHILYFSFYNIEKIMIKENNYDKISLYSQINDIIYSKVKLVYLNFINLFYQIYVKNNYQPLISNHKFYYDYLHKIIFKNIIYSKNTLINKLIIEKISINKINKIVQIVKNVLLCIDIANHLNWDNLPKKLNYLEILYSNKDIIFYIDKLNKIIFCDLYDNRIKKIIIDPFEMLKYLRKEKDFIKWLKFIGPKIYNLFYTPISLSSDDIEYLGKIIYLLTIVKEQNIKDESYLNLIIYCQKYNKLILHDTRINLKIKEYLQFIKCNLNLGFFAKHLIYNNEGGSITLEEDNEQLITIQTHNIIKDKLKIITKKYRKYKNKYIKTKNN